MLKTIAHVRLNNKKRADPEDMKSIGLLKSAADRLTEMIPSLSIEFTDSGRKAGQAS